MVDGERLWDRLAEVGGIGRQDAGGVTRLSFTREERAAKDLVASYMEEAGLLVSEDAAGNLFGRREGKEPGAPAVLVGSHVDSVPNGGDFDGPLGVLSAVEALQTMREAGITPRHPVETVAFTDEEGARFSFGMIGSRALAGTLSPEDLNHRDKEGTTLADALRSSGHDPERLDAAAREPGSIRAYVELHIEQGRVLEREDLSAGIVTGISGPLWLGFTLEGEAGHAGTTPMDLRRDALAAAAEVAGLVEKEASETGTTVGTVGRLDPEPGGINIIPGRVSFTLDLRDIDEAVRDRVEERILRGARELCERRGIGLEVDTLQRVPPAPCSEMVQEAAGAACRVLGLRPYHLASGAGHDAMQLTELCPVGMIFVRSKGGVSHNPAEWSTQRDCADGANLLYRTMLELAGV